MPRSMVLFRVVAMLLAATPVIVTMGRGDVASAQVLDAERGLYRSPTFGYLLRWNPEAWQVADESSEDDVDLLELESDAASVQLAAYEAFGGDPDRCLSDAAGWLGEQGLRSFKPATYENGASAEEHADGQAYGAFLAVPDTGTRDTEYLVQVECRTLIQDVAVLEITSVVSSEDYANGASDGMQLVDNIALPRGAFVVAPDTFQGVSTERIYHSPNSDAFLEFSVSSHDTAVDEGLPDPERGTHWVSVDVAVTNSGDGPGEVDVDRISVSDQYETVTYASLYAWQLATGSADEPVQSLEPGESVMVTLDFELAEGAEVLRVECDCGTDTDAPVVIAHLQADPYGVSPPPPFSGCNPYGWDTPAIVVDQSGKEFATMTGTLWESGDTFALLVAIENAGADRVTIDTRDFRLAVNEDTSYRVDKVSWDLGPEEGRRRRLAPGEQTLALFTFTIAEELSFSTSLYYLGPDGGQRQEVASIGVGGGCGGGGRPKILVTP